MVYLTLDEVRKIVLNYINANSRTPMKIKESSVRDFKWGTLLYLENATNDKILGLPYFLIDKITGEIISIDYQKNLDSQLEEYRKKKGYSHVVKFPAKGDFKKMTPFEKAFALMETEEIYQIKQAVEIIETHNLFSPIGLAEICSGGRNNNIYKSISNGINGKKDTILFYGATIKVIPEEILLFKNSIKNLLIHSGQIEVLPEFITKLTKLECIDVSDIPLKSIPYNMANLSELNELNFSAIKTLSLKREDFVVPRGCRINIE